ncbi:MAG: permease [Thermoanaerobaculia bacterium]|nr:permease [Thermoanaerobaculia bacterium]
MDWIQTWAEAARTATGFFWKAGWAFVLGYAISGMIQAFVPKARLTRHMGDPGARSVSLATLFGAVSSSCSFAALAAARSLVLKGAHFVAAVAFMFASTNLVIELGVLIFIFLGWQYVVAELVGGLLLIAISSALIRLTYPRAWFEAARDKVEGEAEMDEEEFDWKERIRSAYGWHLVGHKFVKDWKMVWEEIVIGFTVAGFVAVLVPASFWAQIFLIDAGESVPQWLVLLENAAVAPFVAAATFIGSMGNIPLATVLASNGVLFAGIMGFIYSDLMVPPLVAINVKYYGRRVAFYIAAVMFASIVATALVLHYSFAALDLTPETTRAVEEVSRFAVDYSFWLNLVMAGLAAWMVALHRKHLRQHLDGDPGHDHEGGLSAKRLVVYTMLLLVAGGLIAGFATGTF